MEVGGQVARTRLAQGTGAGIISCRLHDGTLISTAASTWSRAFLQSLLAASSYGIFLVSFLVAVAEIECLL